MLHSLSLSLSHLQISARNFSNRFFHLWRRDSVFPSSSSSCFQFFRSFPQTYLCCVYALCKKSVKHIYFPFCVWQRDCLWFMRRILCCFPPPTVDPPFLYHPHHTQFALLPLLLSLSLSHTMCVCKRKRRNIYFYVFYASGCCAAACYAAMLY